MLKNQDKKILQDKNKNGKDRCWKERKLENIALGKRLEKLGYRTFERVMHCSEILTFEKNQQDDSLRLKQAWFCKNKLCALCNWRRSLKYSYQTMQIIDKSIEEKPKGRFLFLTLTVKNVPGEKLNQTLSNLTKSFNRLFKYKKVKKNLIGFIRSTEVTVNTEMDMYHPHLHVLLFVELSYFKGNGENYISQKEWQELWQRSAKLGYEPIVDIRAIKPNLKKGTNDIRSAVMETAKYPIKPIDKIGTTEEEKLKITDDLIQGLYKKRQIAFGGLFKKIRKELQLDDLENGNLIQVSEENNLSVGQEIIAIWNWNRQNYFIED